MKNILCQMFLISFYFEAFVQSQSILIKSYNQRDSVTNCTDGLLNDTDTVVFQSFVNITHARSAKIVYFLHKTSMDSDFKSFKTINLTKDCHGDTDCCKLNGSTFVISLRLRAYLKLSKAKLQGMILTAKSEKIFSDVIDFPQIYDKRNITEYLIINGRHVDISNTSCMEHINSGKFNLEFRCTSPAAPCLIRMALNTSNITESNNDVIRYNRKFEESTVFNVNINYAACSLDGYFKTVTCEIRIDPRPLQTLNQNFDGVLTALIITIIIAFVLICCVFCIRKRARRSFKSMYFRRPFRKIKSSTDDNINVSDDDNINVSDDDNINASTDDNISLSTDDNINASIDDKVNLSTDDSNVYVFKDKHQNEKNLRENLNKSKKNNNETRVCKALLDFEHTREPFFEDSVMSIISLIGKLTVMITVETNTGLKRQGTGVIGFATKYGNNENKNKCNCNKCTTSNSESNIEGEIVVYTSTNIVATDEEAKKTTCVLFFDNPNSETLTINGNVLNGIKGQKCKFTCFTCDTKSLDEIIKLRNTFNNENPDFNHTYKRLGKSSSENRTIIISHPFGMHKHISIGKWKKRETRNLMESFTLTKYRYTAPTFHGSAGAYVYLLGRDHGGFAHVHHHLGVDGDGYGYCGFGMDLN